MSETIRISKNRLLFLYLACAAISFFFGTMFGIHWQKFETIRCEHALQDWFFEQEDAAKNTWIYFNKGKELSVPMFSTSV